MPGPSPSDEARDPRGVQSATHWEQVYASGREHVSWYEDVPTLSTELLLSDGVPCLLYTSPSPRD